MSLTPTDVSVNQEVAAQKYVQWQQHQAKDNDWEKAFRAIEHLFPAWFLLSALMIGVITLGMVMLKINPLLAPVKKGVIVMLKFFERFLRDRTKPTKKE